jgi:hypothetical protein
MAASALSLALADEHRAALGGVAQLVRGSANCDIVL